MARRDVQLIPAVEGSTHVNLALAAQFAAQYFARSGSDMVAPPSLVGGDVASTENDYLQQPAGGAARSVAFGYFLDAYRPLLAVANVRILARQAKAFSLLLRGREKELLAPAAATVLPLAQLLATFAYAQLVAENCTQFDLPPQMVSAVFHGIVEDVNTLALSLAGSSQFDPRSKSAARRLILVPTTSEADWDFILQQMLK
jgi:acyl-CoA dehydrogenase